jgi:hypothetical protein
MSNNTELKPYLKVLTPNMLAVCAIFEPHPFRASAIEEAVTQSGRKPSNNTGISDDAWCWVYYDWCGNPVGLSTGMPEGTIVDVFTEENIGSKSLADYLNYENAAAIEEWNRRATDG